MLTVSQCAAARRNTNKDRKAGAFRLANVHSSCKLVLSFGTLQWGNMEQENEQTQTPATRNEGRARTSSVLGSGGAIPEARRDAQHSAQEAGAEHADHGDIRFLRRLFRSDSSLDADDPGRPWLDSFRDNGRDHGVSGERLGQTQRHHVELNRADLVERLVVVFDMVFQLTPAHRALRDELIDKHEGDPVLAWAQYLSIVRWWAFRTPVAFLALTAAFNVLAYFLHDFSTAAFFAKALMLLSIAFGFASAARLLPLRSS